MIANLSVKNTAQRLGKWIAMGSGQEAKAAVFAYGAEVLLGALVKLVLLTLGSLALGSFKYTFAIMAIAAVFRIISGGAHCSSYFQCLMSSLTVFLSLGFLLKIGYPVFLKSPGVYFLGGLLLVAFYWVFTYAPVAPLNRPVKTREKWLKFRFLSISFFLVLAVFVLVTEVKTWWHLAIAMGLIWQSFTLTPYGEGFLNLIEKAFLLPNQREETP